MVEVYCVSASLLFARSDVDFHFSLQELSAFPLRLKFLLLVQHQQTQPTILRIFHLDLFFIIIFASLRL
jgi:hypothetical protein